VGKLSDQFRSIYRVPLRPSSHEERVAAYVIREHERGRSLEEILADPYVRNRLTRAQISRLLDRPEVIHAIGDDTVTAARSTIPPGLDVGADARSRARSTAAAPIATSQAASPFDLKTTTSASDERPATSPGDDLVKLVHLEPVEHAVRDGLDQIGRLDPRLVDRVAAYEGGAVEHGVVELATARMIRADRADQSAVRQPIAAEDGILRRRHRHDDVLLLGGAAVGLGCLGAIRAQELREVGPGAAERRHGLDRRDRCAVHATCVSAWKPQPTTPSRLAPERARYFAATPLAAPVRSCPSTFASITRDAVAAIGVEQHDDERGVAGDGAVGLRPGEAEPAVDLRHERSAPPSSGSRRRG
jgi:hypothetical protein